MLPYVKLIRLKQWVKNFFIFIPIFFGQNLLDFSIYPRLIAGFIAFGLIASSIYILNDYHDREDDRNHPEKRTRPLASGQAKVNVALLLMVLLFLAGITLAYLLSSSFAILALIYVTINVSYSLGLKNVSILDIFMVSSGFMIRVYSGGILGDIPLSHWLVIMVMLLALFLSLAKRRDDLVIKEDEKIIRKASQHYNLEFINSCLSFFAGVIIVAYIMYTVSPEVEERLGTSWLFLTTIFVIAGIMRYLQITFIEEKSGSPTEVLLRDRFLLITILAWITSFTVIIYMR